ncbi:MAG: hypothetical protein P8Y71_00005 [Pseudolabrys sp.]
MNELWKVMSQVFKSPVPLVCGEVALYFAISLQPLELPPTDVDPPGWDRRDELWTIDELLGHYQADKREITLFNRGIRHVAGKLQADPEVVKYLVRIHEYAHAVFHIGVDRTTSARLAEAYVKGNPALERDTASALTAAYSSVDTFVHEQIAQLVTILALKGLELKASGCAAKTACTALSQTFEKLMRRQPPQYRLDGLAHLKPDKLRNRLRAFISLTRSGDVRATRRSWDTLMFW